MKRYYDFIFVVLVYKNYKDLEDFFQHFGIENSKVIVVNSYFDDNSEESFKRIAKSYNADFISVPNKGYGAGNNAGCKWAKEHYEFGNIVISNADINILSLKLSDVKEGVINAPEIINLKGKLSNPMQPFFMPIADKIKYHIFKKGSGYAALYACIAFNKIIRYVFRPIKALWGGQIYSCHGAFLIIPYGVLSTLYPLYNEDQFLFGEEDHLAMLARHHGIKTYYNRDIRVLHKEDGSVGSSNIKVMELTRQSYISFYEYWNK